MRVRGVSAWCGINVNSSQSLKHKKIGQTHHICHTLYSTVANSVFCYSTAHYTQCSMMVTAMMHMCACPPCIVSVENNLHDQFYCVTLEGIRHCDPIHCLTRSLHSTSCYQCSISLPLTALFLGYLQWKEMVYAAFFPLLRSRSIEKRKFNLD